MTCANSSELQYPESSIPLLVFRQGSITERRGAISYPPPARHAGVFTVLLSNVTAPVRASALPFRVANVVSVTEDWAIMVPWNVEPVPSVAELPTCQKMF